MTAARLSLVSGLLLGCGGGAPLPHTSDAAPPASPLASASAPPASSAPARVAVAPPVAACPVGTRAAGARCAASAETQCPTGYAFELGVGCLVDPKSPTDDPYRAAMAAYLTWVGEGPKPGAGPAARGSAFGSLQSAWKSAAGEPLSKFARVEIAARIAELLKVGDEKDAPLWFRRTIEAYQASGAPKGTRPAELAAAATFFLAERDAWDGFDFDTGHLRFTETDGRAIAKLEAAVKEGERVTALFASVADPATFGSYRWAVEALARQASVTRSLVNAHLYVLSSGPTGDDKNKLEAATALLREEEVRRLSKTLALSRAFGVSLPVLASVERRMTELERALPPARFRAARGD